LERNAHRGGEPAIRLGALGAWWQRYFTENAAVWLLRRWNAIEWRRAIDTRAQTLGRELDKAVMKGDYERAKELSAQLAQQARISPTQPRFWQAGDTRRLQQAYGMAAFLLIAYAVAGPVGVFGMLRGSITVLAIALPLLHFVPLVYGALLVLLQREHAQGTSAFLRLARLNGYDLLYGAYTAYALAGAMRTYLTWGVPLLLTLATVVHGSLLDALRLCVQVGVCFLGWNLLWQTLIALLVAPRPTLLWQATGYVLILVVGIFSVLGAPAVAGHWCNPDALRWLNDPSPLMWATRYEFWLSLLFPPIGAMMAPWITHPLWGVLHGLSGIALAWLLAPLAARCLQRALDAPEPEPKSQEGAWW
jgi:hypothetical protein